MKNRIIAFIFAVAALAMPTLAQTDPLPLPPAVEKELAARASSVTEVTLGKNMLGFAAKFMNGKDKDEAATRNLIEGLDGIYVRSYEFDKEGQYSMDEIEQLRKYFETSEWSPMVRERERKTGEITDVMVKLVNGETRGMFILSAEPKELTIVLILGPIRMDDLGKLKGIGGLSALGDVEKSTQVKVKIKDKDKDKKGGDQ
jgi:ribosomal protein S28E/S33